MRDLDPCPPLMPLLPTITASHNSGALTRGLKATQALALMGLSLGHERGLQAVDVSCGPCEGPSPALLLSLDPQGTGSLGRF